MNTLGKACLDVQRLLVEGKTFGKPGWANGARVTWTAGGTRPLRGWRLHEACCGPYVGQTPTVDAQSVGQLGARTRNGTLLAGRSIFEEGLDTTTGCVDLTTGFKC